MLARHGITTDVSPEMLAQWRAKARRLGIVTETLEGEIEPLLTDDPRRWDLIVFSSALHHLDDYVAVAQLAGSRLAPGGVLVSAFDPESRPADRWTLLLRRFDYLLSLAAHPRHLLAAIGRRRGRHHDADHVNYGERAEYTRWPASAMRRSSRRCAPTGSDRRTSPLRDPPLPGHSLASTTSPAGRPPST